MKIELPGLKKFKVITIARALGSGGAEVGQRIAARLGFYYADRQILSRAAKRLCLAEVELSLREERITSFWEHIRDVFAIGSPDIGCTHAPPDTVSDEDIFSQESRIMEVLAQRHDCVVIGRGGRYVFRDHPKALHVLLFAPLDFRVARVMKAYGVRTEAEAIQMIEKSDRTRIRFRERMTEEDPLTATQYHLCIDTGGIALDRVVDLIISYFNAKFSAEVH